MPQLQEIGGMIGASVSGAFLLVIGILNLIVFINLFQMFRQVRRRGQDDERIDRLLEARGFFARITAPLLRFITRSWHVYPLGFLFGLGFDTATEVGLLAMSANAANSSLPLYGILAFPVLFAAGMSLMDTADGIFMTKAYRWAFSDPLRKLYYNLTVTFVAVFAALLIGVTELMQVISSRLSLQGTFWSWLEELDFGILGFVLTGIFIVAWALSLLVWRFIRAGAKQSADA
jgi:high-affinity nickel-transport protein